MDPAREVVRATPCLRLFADTLYVGEDEVRTAMLRLDFEVAGKRTRRGPSEAGRVLDLMAALEASVDAAKKRRVPRKATRKAG